MTDLKIDLFYFKTETGELLMIPLCEVLSGDFKEWVVGKHIFDGKESMRLKMQQELGVKIKDFFIKKGDYSNEHEFSQFIN